MPAGPIGTCWASGSWSATAWEANTWEAQGSGITIPAVLGDLTTLFTQVYLPALRAAGAVGAQRDTATLLANSMLSVDSFDSEDDLNTALAKYIEATY